MNDLISIVHNIHDHAGTVHEALVGGKVSGAVRDRLLDHIMAEELENQKRLLVELENAPPEQRHAVRVALDHSHFIVDIIRGDEIDPAVGLELLHHMLEEFREGYLPTAATGSGVGAAPPPDRSETPSPAPAPEHRQWTVGSLIGTGRRS